ncbi:MAG: hypothetical protein Ct9H300mP6_10200 [Gammaproteobacteria bacterium]|nr:MAG: hypothetical protein Ct9H300mP6_10200 [Gammaproteobacteria bacterium]
MDMVVSNMPPSDRSIHIPTTLYKNLLIETGEANFEDVSREANLFRKAYPKDQEIGGIGNTGGGVAWADYDNDGDLDLYWKCAEYDIDKHSLGTTVTGHLLTSQKSPVQQYSKWSLKATHRVLQIGLMSIKMALLIFGDQ